MVPKLRILSNVIERLSKVDKPNFGNVYGVVCEDSLVVFTYALNITDSEEKHDNTELQWSMPAEVDFCGVLCIDEEPDVSKLLKDVDVTDNPILLKYSLTDKTINAYFYVHEKLENISDVEFINEADALKNFAYVRVQGNITMIPERENVLSTLDNMKKDIAAGKIGFHFSHCNALVVGSDGDEDSPNTITVKDLSSKIARSQHYLENNPQIMNAIPASTLLKVSKSKDSDVKNYAPVIKHVKKTSEFLTFHLKIDALSFVHHDIKQNRLYEILVESVCRNLRLIRKCLECQLQNENSTIRLPLLYHFKPLELGHPITIAYPAQSSDESSLNQRKYLHKIFNLDLLKPCFRIGNTVKFETDVDLHGLLFNPHEAIPTSKSGEGEISLVSGLYTYHHYMQDNFNDDGWGCAYRSLQTLVSWFRLQGYTDKPVPTHHEIQKCLVDIGDKESKFIGSKQWIGSTEVSFVLESLYNIQSRILTASSGQEMVQLASDLAYHFETQGTPVMIGGGVLAHTILGVSIAEDDVKFLILDPHYTGQEDIKTIVNKGWCGWKPKEFWRKDAFYNMCLPQRPKFLTI